MLAPDGGGDFVERAEAAIAGTIAGLGRTVEGRLERKVEPGRIVHFHVVDSSVEVWLDNIFGTISVCSRANRWRILELSSGASEDELIRLACGVVEKEVKRERSKLKTK